MKAKRRPPPPPWERPSRVLWFILALIGASWLTIHMPASQSRMASRMSRSPMPTSSMQTQTNEKNAPISADQKNLGQESLAKKNLGQESLRQENRGQENHKQESHRQAEQSPDQSPEQTTNLQPTSDPDIKPTIKLATQSAPPSAKDKILAKLKSFTRLFTVVGIAAFLGGLIEARCWHMALAWMMGKLTRMARLPEIVGIAMPTALVSSAAANSILVSSHEEGHIRTSALIAGGMANSYLTYLSHSLRVMYPVVAAIGLPGLIYFAVQFSGGFLVILSVFAWNRWYVSNSERKYSLPSPYDRQEIPMPTSPLPWPKAIKKAALRSFTLLFRLVYITVPLMLGIEWLLKNGTFDFWDQYIPAQISRFFPVESVYIVATQIGGLIQSSAVSANLRAEGLIDNAQILLAMLVGSALGNPIRTLRRNLPSNLALFPVPIAFTIVFSMQASRFIITLIGIAGVIAFMQYILYT